MEIIKPKKITVSGKKDSSDGVNSETERTEERISELEGRSIEIIQSKQEKKKETLKPQKLIKKSNAQVSIIHGVTKS